VFKNLLLVTALTVGVTAQPAPTEIKKEEIDIKAFIQKSINDLQNEKSDVDEWIIRDRKQRATGESLSTIHVFTDINPSVEKNNTTPIAQIEDLGFAHDINYSKESFEATSILSLLNIQDLTESEKKLAKKVVDEKIVVMHSDYNLKDNKFNIVFKDINTSAEKATVVTKNVKLSGVYDIDNPLDNKVEFTIDSLDVIPFTAEFLGDYLKIKNLKLVSQSVVKNKTLDNTYNITIDLYDANITKEYSKLSNLDIDIVFGNLDADAYMELEKLRDEDPTTALESEKLQELAIKLVTSKGVYAEIKKLNIGELIVEGKNMGSANISAKVSLEENKELATMIAMNPLMALSSVKVDAKIELSKEMLRAIMKDKRAGLLAILPSKEVDGKIVYVVKYEKGKLTVNGQAL